MKEFSCLEFLNLGFNSEFSENCPEIWVGFTLFIGHEDP
jgi:hypothetical protein